MRGVIARATNHFVSFDTACDCQHQIFGPTDKGSFSFDFVRFDRESQNIFHNLVVLWLFKNLKFFKIINSFFLFSSSENHSQLFQLKQSTEWEQNTAAVQQCHS